MPMVRPARIAYSRNTEWIASRTGLLPRNENDTLDTPPERQRIGQFVADVGAGVDEVHGVVVVFFDAGGHGEDVRVEDDVFRREADFVDQNVVGAFADLFLARFGVGLAGFVERHHHHRGAIAACTAWRGG